MFSYLSPPCPPWALGSLLLACKLDPLDWTPATCDQSPLRSCFGPTCAWPAEFLNMQTWPRRLTPGLTVSRGPGQAPQSYCNALRADLFSRLPAAPQVPPQVSARPPRVAQKGPPPRDPPGQDGSVVSFLSACFIIFSLFYKKNEFCGQRFQGCLKIHVFHHLFYHIFGHFLKKNSAQLLRPARPTRPGGIPS